jgi:hypothetical protein
LVELDAVLPQDMSHLHKKRDNAWLRELIGRLSLTRAVTVSRPIFLAQAEGRWPIEFG